MSENRKITGLLGAFEEEERSRHRRVEVNPYSESFAILARALWDAEHDVAAIDSLSSVIPDLGVSDGYAIRREVDLLRMIAGAVPVGRKVGLASRQAMLLNGLDEPFWSYIFTTGAVPDGSVIDLRHYIQPRAEAEVAFILSKDLDDPNTSPEAALAAVGAVCPAIEIVDVRTGDWNTQASESVADSGRNAGFILGDQVPLGPDINPDAITARMRTSNAGTGPLGRTSDLVGGPVGILAWLASKLAETGEPLRAGEIILTGTLTPPVRLEPGVRYTAEFAGFGNALGIVRMSAR